ncbi:hypothetical protein P8605_50070, partial [Streptomyces sp. T-3]|nr:hypothetical protein [Streptomyces sp. T-3]
MPSSRQLFCSRALLTWTGINVPLAVPPGFRRTVPPQWHAADGVGVGCACSLCRTRTGSGVAPLPQRCAPGGEQSQFGRLAPVAAGAGRVRRCLQFRGEGRVDVVGG